MGECAGNPFLAWKVFVIANQSKDSNCNHLDIAQRNIEFMGAPASCPLEITPLYLQMKHYCTSLDNTTRTEESLALWNAFNEHVLHIHIAILVLISRLVPYAQCHDCDSEVRWPAERWVVHISKRRNDHPANNFAKIRTEEPISDTTLIRGLYFLIFQ